MPVPAIPEICEGFEAQDVQSPDVSIAGEDCNEDAIRAAVEGGGTVLVDCPDAPVRFTAQMVVSRDTVLDGAGVTVFDGGGSTRLLRKRTGVTLHVQNITLQNARGPEALGNPEVTQANWFEWAGGAILAECYDDGRAVGGALYGKNLVCRDNAAGSSSTDDGRILDTGTGGCVYSFTCPFHCDECEFANNEATLGGAIGTLGGRTQITHSTCVGNRARFDSSDNVNQGFGGCYYQDGTETAPGEEGVNYVHMCGNFLADNQSQDGGGAVSLYYRQDTNTSFAFVRNVCEANRAGYVDGSQSIGGGGCLYVYVDPDTRIPWATDQGRDSFVVSGNAFIDNSAELLGGGAAIFNIWQTSTRFDNNLFLRNEVRATTRETGGGGGLWLLGAFFDLEHNTFAQNRANNQAAGVILGAGGVGLRNNLFYENDAPAGSGSERSPAEHVNWNLDESDDGNDGGFLVFASGGNLYFPPETPQGSARPTPGGTVDGNPSLGELVRDDGFPFYLPLLPGSPAIDAGVEVAEVEVDIRGQQRVGAPDIGAFEASR